MLAFGHSTTGRNLCPANQSSILLHEIIDPLRPPRRAALQNGADAGGPGSVPAAVLGMAATEGDPPVPFVKHVLVLVKRHALFYDRACVNLIARED